MYSRTIQYNCTIIDLYNRSVVASKNVKKITADLAISPLQNILVSNQSSDKYVQFKRISSSLCISQNMSRQVL